MDASQIIGLGGLVLIALVSLWVVGRRRKREPAGEPRGEGPGEGTHGISSETFRRAGEDQPGGD